MNRTLPKTFGLITVKGDDGHGCYAGIAITIARLIRLPIFWVDFFAQEEAKEHDEACESIDWTQPEQAYHDYAVCTLEFYVHCLAKADGKPQLVWDSQIAYWFAKRFGDLRYELARK